MQLRKEMFPVKLSAEQAVAEAKLNPSFERMKIINSNFDLYPAL